MTKKGMSPEQMAAVEARCSKKAAVAAVKAGTVARRVVLFPTKEQKHQLQKAFEACRWVYNKCVEALNANKKTAIKALRERFVNKAAWGRICSEVDVEWADIPYEVRDGALRDAIKAKASTEAHLDNEAAVAGKPESTKKWVFKFRKKKEIIESLQLRKRDLNGGNAWFARLFGTKGDRSATRTKSGNCLPSQFASDVRLIHDKRLGVYFITIAVLPCAAGDSQACFWQPGDMDVVAETTTALPIGELRVGSIDPGCRTFLTVFDTNTADAHKLGEQTARVLWPIANKLHSLQRRMDKLLQGSSPHRHRHRTRRHMRRAARRLELRLRHLVDELHHQTAHWLATTYDAILLPKFSTKSVATKRDGGRWKRKITKKTVSNLYSLAHYRFRQFLQHKAAQHGSLLILVTEQYTTKTCSRCGHMRDVGGAEVYHCTHCGLVVDRDINASFNILLKFIHDQSELAQRATPPQTCASRPPVTLFGVDVEAPAGAPATDPQRN